MTRSDDGALGVADDPRRAGGADVAGDDAMVANAKGALDVVREISTTVDGQLDEISRRAETQADDAAAAVDDVSDLSATVEEIAATATEVSDRSERAAERAAEGRASAREAIEVMEDVRAVSTAVADEVEAFRARVDGIADALAGIDDIAAQTNLLALNASIEAARAGEAGSGFAVVADEVKSLAEEAQAQADEIDAVLGAVREETDETVDHLESAVSEIDRGTEQVEETMESLDAVTEAVEETASGTKSVSEATDQQAKTTEAVAGRIERVAEGADHIEDDVETIRGARAEQTTMLREISGALDSASRSRSERIADTERIPTGVDGLDDLCDGGFAVGSRAVVQHDGEVAVGGLVAQLAAAALDAGYAVSVTPPPSLDRRTLAAAVDAVGLSFEAALGDDRLFVLDAFGEWQTAYNVFDLDSEPLDAVNRTTAERRSDRLFVIGNIAGEIAVMGESAAREARYANDDGVLDDRDTVLNVVDGSTVAAQFGAFYAGAADYVLRAYRDGAAQHVEFTTAPAGVSTATRRLRTRDRPPYATLVD
ncbi:methyl-accepting chemotaxis protein [Haloferax denitrificans]|uniref:Transducer protein htr34 n=1 Tax=Haloferax denitrificans ATCC 35960 TaxID=662478 RepID=M0JHL9_9EURY|nr:methyl-accepting chemotaxis protein [Haloferax denitrificans]EMA07180.1 transducer protein htr34 [Haloferax denitrificans ATCC 35960]